VHSLYHPAIWSSEGPCTISARSHHVCQAFREALYLGFNESSSHHHPHPSILDSTALSNSIEAFNRQLDLHHITTNLHTLSTHHNGFRFVSRLRPVLRGHGLYLCHRLYMLRLVLLRNTISLSISNHDSKTGAAYGTAKSGVGIAAMGVLRPDLIVKSIALLHSHPASY
jgi:hypothetical protein